MLTTTLWVRYCCLHFTDDESEVPRSSLDQVYTTGQLVGYPYAPWSCASAFHLYTVWSLHRSVICLHYKSFIEGLCKDIGTFLKLLSYEILSEKFKCTNLSRYKINYFQWNSSNNGFLGQSKANTYWIDSGAAFSF